MRKIFMKNIFSALLVVASSSIISFSQNGYAIKGNIKGLHDTTVRFGNHFGDKQYVKDTTRVDKNGNFIFKGDKKLDGGIYLIVLPSNKYFEILVDKEQNFSVETDTTSKMVENLKVKGSEDNANFYKYLRFISDEQKKIEPFKKRVEKIKEDSVAAATTKKDSIKILQDRMSAVDKEVEQYKQDFIKSHPESFLATIFKAQTDPAVPETPVLPNGKKDSTFPYRYYKTHYWDNVPLSDDRLLRSPIFHNKLKYYL